MISILASPATSCFTYAALLLAVAGVKAIFQFLTRWILIGVSREIEFDLRNDLFAHLERLSYSYYQRTRTGDIMARMTNDLNAVRMLVGPGIMYTANTVVFTVGALAFMLTISPKLTIFAFAPLPIVSVVVQYFGRKIHDRFERIQAMFSEISARAQENFSGARIIRAYVQEEAEIEAFERANQEYIGRSLKLVRLMGMLWPTLEMLLGVAIVIVLWVGGNEVIHHRITVGSFVAFNTYMVQLTWPVIALGWVINIFQRGTASALRIESILAEPPEITDAGVPATAAPTGVVGEIEFRNLSFHYGQTLKAAENGSGRKHGDDNVLRNVSLKIPAGTSLAIVGPTGSGKSTLVSLIPRLYDSASGSVLIDGRPIREFPLELLRKSIGFVPQETFLFSDSIRENIAFGDGHATDADVRRVAEAADIASRHRKFSRGIQHSRRRARTDTLRRTEAAYRHRPRLDSQSPHPGARRCVVQRRHSHRRPHSQPTARNHARPYHHLHLPSRLHRAQRGSHRRAPRRPDRRVRNPRSAHRPQWLLHRALQQAVAGRRIGNRVAARRLSGTQHRFTRSAANNRWSTALSSRVSPLRRCEGSAFRQL